MRNLKVLAIIFFVVLIASFFAMGMPQVFSALLIAADLVLLISLLLFISRYRKKNLGKIVLESIHYPLTYVLRAYTKPKNLWIVFDYKKNKFKPADWKSLPKVVFILLVGSFLVYISYLIIFTINQAIHLFLFRVIILFIFFLVGIYTLFLGLYRLFSFGTTKADKAVKYLNTRRLLINRIKSGKLFVQITPNFLLKEGFVNSAEFIIPDDRESNKLEKELVALARLINKL